MTKKKGLSFEEKSKKMLEIFHESQDFYTLKELEKIAPKQKGIVVQSVKEVLEMLVADGEIQMEKIGTSNYFWSFPSTLKITRQNKLEKFTNELEEVEQELVKVEERITKESELRVESAERDEKLKELSRLESEVAKVSAELKKYEVNDPEAYEEKKKQISTLKESVNLWTENIFALQSYCRDKFMMDQDAFEKNFGIPADIDTF